MRLLPAVPLLLAVSVTALPAQDAPARRLVQIFRIDANVHDMDRVGGVAVSAAGRVAVTQPRDGNVLIFPPTGEPVVFGRRGGGPGEFRAYSELGWRGDSLWIADGALKRVTVLGPDGAVLRTIPYPTSDAFARTPGLVDRRATGISALRMNPRGDLLLRMQAIPRAAAENPGPGRVDVLHALVEFTSRGATGVRLELPDTDPPSCRVEGSEKAGYFWSAFIPHCPKPAYALSPDGTQVVVLTPAEDGAYTLVSRRVGSALTVNRRLRAEQVRIPPASLEELRSAFVSNTGLQPGMRNAYRDMTFPTHYPPFRSVLLGDDGWIWIEQDLDPDTRRWLVLSPDAMPAFALAMPARVKLKVVSRDEIWAVVPDADDLEHVMRYRVE
ncbi:MAG: hypothetical protein AB7L91_17840 [Dehalococcoidia bacterium]